MTAAHDAGALRAGFRSFLAAGFALVLTAAGCGGGSRDVSRREQETREGPTTVTTRASGTISTFAGTCGLSGNDGDGGAAAGALFTTPEALEVLPDGTLYVADQDAHVVRRIDPSGSVSTVAGTGEGGYSGDGGPAVKASLSLPVGLARDDNGNLYIADFFNNAIRKVDRVGEITTVAGTGEAGYSGDGGLATRAKLTQPSDIAVDHQGEAYIVDHESNRIRKIDASGMITTLAGTGTPGYSGDGGPAVKADLANPAGVALDAEGNLYVTDRDNHRIRKIERSGIITTVAGTGRPGYSGDGEPATKAEINAPDHIWMDARGDLYIDDRGNNVIRKVDASGSISTVAGNGESGFQGDGGPATDAQLSAPGGIGVDRLGRLYVADTGNGCVRVVEPPRRSSG